MSYTITFLQLFLKLYFSLQSIDHRGSIPDPGFLQFNLIGWFLLAICNSTLNCILFMNFDPCVRYWILECRLWIYQILSSNKDSITIFDHRGINKAVEVVWIVFNDFQWAGFFCCLINILKVNTTEVFFKVFYNFDSEISFGP